ncbi:hypothetical protein Tco_1406807 [Tanacetum coccineum]
MSFSKRAENALICYTRPLDSLKNWNDHFFWVDTSVFPLVVLWRNDKTLWKYPHPTPLNLTGHDTIKNLDENCYRPSGLMMMRVGVLLLASFGANRKRELLRNGDAAEANQTEQGEHVVDFRGIKWWAKMRCNYKFADKPQELVRRNRCYILWENYCCASHILESSTLPVEVGVTTTTTVPFVTSSVTPPDSISRTGLQTRHPAERFVISLDSSHDLNANATDDEVTSVIRSSMPPPPILTVAIATTIIAGATSAPVHESGAGQVRPSIFRDFASPNMAEADVVGPF